VVIAQKCIKFHLQPFKFEKNSGGETPGPLLTGAGREKGSGYRVPTSKRREGGKGQERDEREAKEGMERASGRGDLAPI